MKIWNVLSLGAGVQSSCLALMAEKGQLKDSKGSIIHVDFAIFADTKGEPYKIYKWLNWLEDQLSYPVYTVSEGSLEEESLEIQYNKKTGESYMPKYIPNFGRFPDGGIVGALGRSCTRKFKIVPIRRKLKELCDIKRGQKNATVNQMIGISMDEMQRMKTSPDKWIKNTWPLVDMRMDRRACKTWMRENGYPEPPRSACYYCPFQTDAEWKMLRDDEPDLFQKAIDFDNKVREMGKKVKKLKMELFLHRRGIALQDIDFDNDIDKGQMVMFEEGNHGEIVTVMDMQNECEGLCGV